MIEADALVWMANTPAEEGMSVVTSLPDVSEISSLSFDAWRAWFIDAARAVMRWTPASGASIFYQSDIRHQAKWIDKGYLVLRAAEEENASLLWHKVVCRKPPGTISLGRPTYSHMIAVTRGSIAPSYSGADVVPDAGEMNWSRAMGEKAAEIACAYLRDAAKATTIVDPFCGRGTVLHVANAMGLGAIGVDISGARCRKARSGGASDSRRL